MITQIEQFKEVIEGNYKILDLKSYMDYKIDVSKRGLTQQEIDLLSPDNIDSGSFWEYIDKNPEIAKDAIAFGITKDQTVQSVNQMNFNLACNLNVLSYIILYRGWVGMPLLDIGAGYGMLKEYVEKETKLAYIGVDVYPKIEGVYPVGADGSTLPPNIAESKFGLVISSNVFQHLSVKQRRHYYAQVEKILYPKFGIFTFTTMGDNPTAKQRGFKCNDNGRRYACHYGQYTEIQTLEEIKDDLSKHFGIISICERPFDSSLTFHCCLKDQELKEAKLDNEEKI